MRVNTKTGSLDLTKRETQTLVDAKALLLTIAKHGPDDVSEQADRGADSIGEVQAWLAGPVPVGPDGEEIKPPY